MSFQKNFSIQSESNNNQPVFIITPKSVYEQFSKKQIEKGAFNKYKNEIQQ